MKLIKKVAAKYVLSGKNLYFYNALNDEEATANQYKWLLSDGIEFNISKGIKKGGINDL